MSELYTQTYDEVMAEERMRQEAVYRFLLSRGDKWTPMDQVTSTITSYPAFFPGKNYHNSTARRLLSYDVQVINGSDVYDKIIISGNKGLKLATESEFEKFISTELKECFKKLKRCRRLARKGSRDQQLRIEGRIAEEFLKGGVKKDG